MRYFGVIAIIGEDLKEIKFKLSLPPPSRGTRTASDVQNVARALSRPLRLRKTEKSTVKVRNRMCLVQLFFFFWS